jgi:esterase/lipase superfamily enzyme
MASDVFISYCSGDRPLADAVGALLQKYGIRFIVRKVLSGAEWGEAAIERTIRESRFLLVVFTARTNASGSIERELAIAVDAGLHIVVLRMENIEPGERLKSLVGGFQWIDAWTPPLETHMRPLLLRIESRSLGTTNPFPTLSADEPRPVFLGKPPSPRKPPVRLLDPLKEWLRRRADGAVHSVWFGTNREPIDPIAPSKGFSRERSDRITFGRVEVIIPKAHRFGEIGVGLWKKIGRADLRDDRLRVAKIITLATDEMWQELREKMESARSLGDAPHALVYLHGYNNSFEDAAIRAGQIGFDLKVSGATAFFSWPSRDTLAGYAADEASIEASEGAITEFLVAFAKKSGAEKVHIIAHSMGNRGLLRTLQRIAADAETRGSVRFGQIFLAAPDIDRDLFLGLAHLYPACSDRTTLYASKKDLPVFLSSKFHAAPRAGYFLPHTVAEGIDTVAVPDFDLDLLGHGYFAEASAILHDIYDLMRHNAPPRARQRVEPFNSGTESLWQIRR